MARGANPLRRAGVGHLAALCASTYAAAAEPPIPPPARQAIDQVHAAAARNDLAALRGLMTEEFTWSFGAGADTDPDQAIAAWRQDTDAIAALERITAEDCDRVSEQTIECPRGAGMSWRAGFTESPDGWRLAYFVAGD